MPCDAPVRLQFVLLVLTMALAGCGGERSISPSDAETTVSGVVTLDGQALANATVSFESADGTILTGNTDDQGAYSLQPDDPDREFPTGKFRVRVSLDSPLDAAAERNSESGSALPARYHSESEIVRDIFPGTNKIRLELQSNDDSDSERE